MVLFRSCDATILWHSRQRTVLRCMNDAPLQPTFFSLPHRRESYERRSSFPPPPPLGCRRMVSGNRRPGGTAQPLDLLLSGT